MRGKRAATRTRLQPLDAPPEHVGLEDVFGARVLCACACVCVCVCVRAPPARHAREAISISRRTLPERSTRTTPLGGGVGGHMAPPPCQHRSQSPCARQPGLPRMHAAWRAARVCGSCAAARVWIVCGNSHRLDGRQHVVYSHAAVELASRHVVVQHLAGCRAGVP
jgi:hypothetical protein